MLILVDALAGCLKFYAGRVVKEFARTGKGKIEEAVQAVPNWLDDWEQPEQFSNPFFIRTIRQEGVPL